MLALAQRTGTASSIPHMDGAVEQHQPSPATADASAVIALVASAGGLGALTGILGALPANLPAALIVAQHQNPRGDDLLARVLQSRTELVLRPAADGLALQPGVVALPLVGLAMLSLGSCCPPLPGRGSR